MRAGPPERAERRLAAILAADVAGYSRLIGTDEEGTLARLRAARSKIIDPTIARHRGRLVKTTGDGLLVEFASVIDALRCAGEVQAAMAERNACVPPAHRFEFRIGIHQGDIVAEDGDIFGDGVNVAARLEGIADPGGICVSARVQEDAVGKLALAFEDIGEQALKNIARPVHVFRVAAGASRPPGAAIEVQQAALTLPDKPPITAAAAPGGRVPAQEIHFCAAPDGVQIAYAAVGDGPPLVKAANYLQHLEYDWESPVWQPFLRELAAGRKLVRYDARGNGLSDWDAADLSFEACVADLESVVEAVGLDRFPVFGISQGCAIAIAYTVRHPERVTRLVLYGGFARGKRRRGSQLDIDQADALLTLMRTGWGQENPAFRQIFTSLFIPGGTPEQMQWWDTLQRLTTSPENAVRLRRTIDDIDISGLLPRVGVPTLVMHCRDDAVQPFSEGRRLAAGIPGARFVPLEGRNHVILEGDPIWPRFFDEIRAFLSD